VKDATRCADKKYIQSINLIFSVCPIKMTNSALKTEFQIFVPPTRFLLFKWVLE